MPKGVTFRNNAEETNFNFRNLAAVRGESRRKPLVNGKNARGKAPPIPKGDPRRSNNADELLSATGRHYTEATARSKASLREGINRTHSMKAKKWANYGKSRKLLTGVNKAMREDPAMKNLFSPIVNSKARKALEEYYNNANIQNLINTRGRSKRNQKEASERGVADLLGVSNWKKHNDPATGFSYWHSDHFDLSHWNINGRNGWKKLNSKDGPYWVHEKKGLYHFNSESGPAGGGKRTRRNRSNRS
jgi:hypothetical protein